MLRTGSDSISRLIATGAASRPVRRDTGRGRARAATRPSATTSSSVPKVQAEPRRLLGGAGERFEDESRERGAGELRSSRTASPSHAGRRRARPRSPGRSAAHRAACQHGGDLPYREDGGDQPQPEPGRAQSRPGRLRAAAPNALGRSPTVFHVRHAPSALPPRSSRVRPVRSSCRARTRRTSHRLDREYAGHSRFT